MKVIIQIPCFNEEQTLSETLNALPKSLPGIDLLEVLIVDDGSSDQSLEIAKAFGVKNIVCLGQHRGLGTAFKAGLERCLALGADIIVNVDADNQYCAQDIQKLIKPILDDNASLVIGERPISHMPMSAVRRLLQRTGSLVVSLASGCFIPDAVSGFRAMTAALARQLPLTSSFTYTTETIIDAARKGCKIVSVPIKINKVVRPSRLVSNLPYYLWQQSVIIVKTAMRYGFWRKEDPLNPALKSSHLLSKY